MSDILYDIKLGDDGDLFLCTDENNLCDIELITGGESTLQSVRLALSILKNEYVFRPDYGVPLLAYDSDDGNFLLSRLSDDIKRNILSSVIMSVDGVSSIENMSFELDRGERILGVKVDIKTDSGETITLTHIERE